VTTDEAVGEIATVTNAWADEVVTVPDDPSGRSMAKIAAILLAVEADR